MVDLNERKLELIQEVSQIRDEQDLSQLEAALLIIKDRKLLLQKRKKPMPKKFDPDVVRRLHGFKGQDKEAFMTLVRELKVQEPVETLLALLTK